MPVQKRKLAPGNCAHCGIDETQTSLWRTGANKEKLCNACGLYVQTHGRMRPLSVLGSRKKADGKKTAADEPKDSSSRPEKSKSSRHRSGSSSISSSVGSLVGGTSTSTTPSSLSLETRPSRSASISTSSTSLPSPTFSAPEDYLSPQFQSAADSPPPSMSASLAKLEDASVGGAPRSGTSVGVDELGAYVRAKNGQKRHSISGGSSLGYPHQVTNPNHSVSKAQAASKKKARFELQHIVRPLTVNTLASLSSSAPTSSPISIAANTFHHQRTPSTVCLPCSKCAVLLPHPVSSSVPLHEDPVCERCLDQAYAVKPLTSSSVPARSSAHLMMTSSLAPSSALAGWESEDEDYEFVDPPAPEPRTQALQQQQLWSKRAEQHHQFPGTGSHTWSLEEEFSFLDTSFAVDSDPMLDSMDDVPPRVTLAGWGGPFFKNMPMPPGKKFGASALQEPSFPSPMLGGGVGPAPAPSLPFPSGPHANHHRAYTSPTSSSSSSTSSLSSFSPNSAMPSPLTNSFTHDPNGLPTPLSESNQFNIASSNSKGLLLGLANLQPSLSRQQALPVTSSPHQAFAAAAQARLPIRPFLSGSLGAAATSIPAGADGLDYLVGAPLSPIFPGGGPAAASSVGMKRTGSARSGSLFRWDAGGEGEPMQVEMEAEGLVAA